MNDLEVSLLPLEEAEDVAAIALRDVQPEFITQEVCEWAITQAMKGMPLLAIRQQALEAEQIALSLRVDKVESKIQQQQEEISMLKAGQYAQDKIMGFLQGQTQQAQNMAMDSAKENGKKHLWIHDPTGMALAFASVFALIVLLLSMFTRVEVVKEASPRRESQEVRP